MKQPQKIFIYFALIAYIDSFRDENLCSEASKRLGPWIPIAKKKYESYINQSRNLYIYTFNDDVIKMLNYENTQPNFEHLFDGLQRELQISSFLGDEFDIQSITEEGCYISNMDGSY